MGMGNKTPSDRRNDSTTLTKGPDPGQKHDRQVLPGIVFFIHETLQRAETSVLNEFKIAQLALT
jgi:hypothetical protein